MTDAQGRVILIDENCRFCGTSSTKKHPAGVVSGRWLCSCGRRQDEIVANAEEIKRSRNKVEA